ncbi:ABC transporter permease, partial [Micromonospora azadirachtae]
MSVTDTGAERRTGHAPSGSDRRRVGFTERLLAVRELSLLLALGALILVTTLRNDRFLSGQSVKDLLLGCAILVILAVGQTLVIVTRNVDLSVGSILGLVAFATGSLFLAAPGTPWPVAVLLGVALGAVCGAVNGGLIAVAKVPALVITLGTLYAFRGIDYYWASGRQINAADMPRSFLRLGNQTVLGVPLLFLAAVVVVAAVGYYLRSYRSGRELYAIGSEPAAARLSGIPVGRRVFAVFVANGAL